MRKVLVITIWLSSILGYTQVKGNKVIITKSFNLEKVEVVKINVYAKVSIDCNSDNKITIKADENLIKYIDKKVENGVLNLNQLEWIKASQKIEIDIGAPYLREIETGTHDITFVENFNNKDLKIIAPIGNVQVSGTTEYITIKAKNGTVDASQLSAKNAYVNITGDSKTTLFVSNKLDSKLSEDAQLKLVNKPKIVSGDARNVSKKLNATNDIQWIKFRIKNNSWNRHNFVVVGPKKDGSKFSYGFAMMPGTTKNERWSVGSNIYKSTILGSKKLLVTIVKEDEKKVVKLFKD